MVGIMELIDFLASDFLNGLRQQMKAPLLDYSELPFRNGISYAEFGQQTARLAQVMAAQG